MGLKSHLIFLNINTILCKNLNKYIIHKILTGKGMAKLPSHWCRNGVRQPSKRNNHGGLSDQSSL